MSCPQRVYQWNTVVRTHLPHLTTSQAYVLAAWSVGLVLARSCAVSAVSTVLSQALGRPYNNVRAQLREWCYEAGAKRGTKRRELDVESCFAPLLRWVLSWWTGRQVA